MLNHRFHSRKPAGWLGWLLFCVTITIIVRPAEAQLLRGRLRPSEPEVEAFAGTPYGVGRWLVPLPAGTNPALFGNSGFTLSEKNGRAMFQAFQAEPIRTVAREFLGRPQMATVYFLFTGNGPLELQLFAPTGTTTTVTPRQDPVAHARLLSDWWVKYTRQADRIDRPADYPDMVDNYLLATLSRRLNLPPAGQMPRPPIRGLTDIMLSQVTGQSPKSTDPSTSDEHFDDEIGLLFGSDNLRGEMQTDVLLRRPGPAEPADQPLPAGFNAAATVPETLGEVTIEPLAKYAPAECFYLRFGNFSNYFWYRHTMDRWSGDLKNLLNRRGLDYGIQQRIERQISLKESALAEILGPAVIADVALIGGDMFFREGAAFGVLFQARNNFALSTDFNRQRAETLQREAGCTDKQVEIAGHKVSFLSTPDNRVRSFYAVDGDIHFVSNSWHLVERFFEAGQGKGALGGTAEFRFARSQMPVSRDYTVFAYLSDEFFKSLTGPRYQVEMLRRLRSAAEIDVAQVAELAARSEGQKVKSLDELVRMQYLPEGFGQHSDGSHIELTSTGQWIDSLRGARGSFLPTPDTGYDHITADEVKHYQDFAAWFQSKWSQLDPVMLGVRREASRLKEPGAERVILDAQLTPMAAKNYDTIAAALGPIAKQRLAPIPGDIVSGEALLSGGLMALKGMGQSAGPYRLFGALRDDEPDGAAGGASNPQARAAPSIRGPGLAGPLAAALMGNSQGASTLSPMSMLPPFYFGSYPIPAPFFGWLGIGEAQLDAAGYGQSSPGGMWQRRFGKFTVASQDRALLESVTPRLQFIDAPRPAQAWFHVGDLGRSKLAGTINGLFYRAAKNAAIGNVRFLHALNAQLHVPTAEALEAAEQLTDAIFVDPVGGKYQVDQRPGTLPTWVSTALPPDRMRLIDGFSDPAPADYSAPILSWLKNLDADLALDKRVLSLHAEVEMTQNGSGSVANTSPAAAPVPAAVATPAPTPPPTSKKSREELPPPPPQPAR